MILINKHNISAVLPAVSNEESRYTMRAIHITEQFTEATDGRRAIRVSNPKENPINFPTVPGFTPNGFKEGLLTLDAAKQLEKAFPKRMDFMPILNHAAVTQHEGKMQIAVTDLKNPQVINPQQMTGNFPDLQKTLDSAKSECTTFQITVDPEYLMQLAQSAKKFGASCVTMKFGRELGVMLMEAESDGQQWTAALMPKRK